MYTSLVMSSWRCVISGLLVVAIAGSVVSAVAAPGGRGGARGGPRGGAGGRGGVQPGGPGQGGARLRQAGPGAVARPADVEKFLGAKPAGARTDAAIAGRTRPFTGSWYADHPDAWHDAHPGADWWVVPGAAGVYGWLGVPYAGAGTAAATAAAAATTAGAATAPPADLEWLPLGVFATGPKGTEQPHIFMQLAVSKKGEVKGNYYDAVSDATQPIIGVIDATNRKATWSVGKGAAFETTLDAILDTPSDVTMKSNASTQTWQLVQMKKP